MVTENEILHYAINIIQTGHGFTMEDLRKLTLQYFLNEKKLTHNDLAVSNTRPNEIMFYQRVRNIVCHDKLQYFCSQNPITKKWFPLNQ